MKKYLFLFLFLLTINGFFAIGNKLNVYFDIKSYLDFNYIRNKLQFINYVNEPKVANIYILVQSETTASQGELYTLDFSGQGRFKTLHFSLTYNKPKDQDKNSFNQNITNIIKKGLFPFMLLANQDKNFEIIYNKPMKKQIIYDPWKKWIFKISLNGYANGSENSQTIYSSMNFNISKMTKKNIYSLYFNYDYNITTYDYGSIKYTDNSITRSVFTKIVKGINEHISLAFFSGGNNSKYSNLKLKVYLKGGAEYNLIPYSKFSKGEFKFQYLLSSIYQEYYEETIYNKFKEMLYKEELNIFGSINKKWGDLSLGIYFSNYMHDFSKNSFGAHAGLNIRLTRHLSFNTFLSYSFIHDQLTLTKSNASEEEVFLRIKELKTSYSYFVNFGLTYQFGSIFNNIVNTRF